jgi:DNA recombination protein RmuC
MGAASMLFFLLGALLGAVVGILAMHRSWRSRAALEQRDALSMQREELSAQRLAAERELAQTAERLAARNAELEVLRQDLRAARDETGALRAAVLAGREEIARLRSEIDEARERAAVQLSFFDTARETLHNQFKTLATEVLEEKGKRLSESHRGELGLVLGPLSEKLTAFQNKVEEVYTTEGQHRFSLLQEVRRLQETNQRMSDEALNLTRALKGQSKTRGNWGEVMLEAILERSGLHKGREYEVQATLNSQDGIGRPDVVVRLPEAKHIVIDSKVSLIAYDRYYSAENDADREAALREHVQSLRRHVADLGTRNYQGHNTLNSPDFVAMFVPIEPAFNLAAGADPSLIFDAFDRKVVIVTPGTLLAMLSTVATLWRRELQNRNALEIARQAGEIHDKFVLVIESFTEAGQRLERAQESFARARDRLVDGRGSVVKRLDDLKKLGAKTNRKIPGDLLSAAGALAESDVEGDDDVPPAPLFDALESEPPIDAA